MTALQRYVTRTGKAGVVCACGRRALLTPAGRIFRHSPLDRRAGAWCENGGKLLSEVGS